MGEGDRIAFGDQLVFVLICVGPISQGSQSKIAAALNQSFDKLGTKPVGFACACPLVL